MGPTAAAAAAAASTIMRPPRMMLETSPMFLSPARMIPPFPLISMRIGSTFQHQRPLESGHGHPRHPIDLLQNGKLAPKATSSDGLVFCTWWMPWTYVMEILLWLAALVIHGAINTVSWGILFPIGIMIARYLKTFADPAWFYVHVSCQMLSYILGLAGWSTGMRLGRQYEGVEYTSHRYIGIALSCLATLQIFALFWRPKPHHKYRCYWNAYHHGVGYVVLVLGIINVFKGLEILGPPNKWKMAYILFLAVLGGIAIVLEVILKRKADKSTKLYDGQNGSNGGQ